MSKRRFRVLRGGSYVSYSWFLRTTDRIRREPERRNWNRGFRVVIKRRRKP